MAKSSSSSSRSKSAAAGAKRAGAAKKKAQKTTKKKAARKTTKKAEEAEPTGAADDATAGTADAGADAGAAKSTRKAATRRRSAATDDAATTSAAPKRARRATRKSAARPARARQTEGELQAEAGAASTPVLGADDRPREGDLAEHDDDLFAHAGTARAPHASVTDDDTDDDTAAAADDDDVTHDVEPEDDASFDTDTDDTDDTDDDDDDDDDEIVADYEPRFVKKAPPLPGQDGAPAADLTEMGEMPMPELVDRLSYYGLTAHEGMDRARLLTQFMRHAHRKHLDVRGGGQLEILPDGYGFLRSVRNAYLPSADDLYVSPDLVKKFGLRAGMFVVGGVRQGRRGDKYFAVESIESVNGEPPEAARDWKPFDDLVPVFPDRRILLETPDRQNVSTRVLDLVAPLGFGQRALVTSPPRSGKTVLMKAMANAVAANYPDVKLLIFLVDERPEEVTDMQRTVDGEVIASTFDESPQRHIQVADRVNERARSLVESGHDVVVMLDSLTRLGRAYNAVARGTGRILSGGLEANALQKPKRFFGAARNIEGGGSLTIVATALIETNSRMDEVIFEEFKGTGNSEVVLNRELSEQRIYPAIDLNKSGTRMEDLLYDPAEAKLVQLMRQALADLRPVEAMEKLLEKLRKTQTNAEFLLSLMKAAGKAF